MTTLTTLMTRAATVVVAALTLAVPAGAQARHSGFVLGVHSVAVPGIAIGGGEGQNGEFNTTFGAGAGVTLGYGFGETFSLFGSLDMARQKTAASDVPQGSWGLAHLELGARVNVPLGVGMTPYLTGSYGGRSLAARATFEDGAADVSISGKFFAVGAGIERAISSTMSLDGGVDVGFGKFSHFKVGDDESDDEVNPTRSIRMRLGVLWRPGAH